MELGSLQGLGKVRHIIEEEPGARGVRLDYQGLVLECIEILLDFLVTGLGLELDAGKRAGKRNFASLALLAGHQALDILGFSGLDSVASGGLKENASVAQRDGAIAIVGDDETHRHDAVAEIIDAEDGLFFPGVIGFGGDGHLFVRVHLDGGKGCGRLHGGRSVVAGPGGQGLTEKSQQEQQKWNCPHDLHRARLYHLNLDSGKARTSRMILIFYNLALLVALVAGTPWWLWKMATTHKYRVGLGERLGRVKRFKKQGGRPTLWLHAVSVGEILAVSRLVGELDRALPEFRLLISTTTRTGQDLAKQRFGAERVFYCPLDLPWAVGAYLNALQPRLLILAETEFWPNLLNGCFRRSIPVLVVNARISDRSWPRYRMLKGPWKSLLSRITRLLAQTETDAERLQALGCLTERVSVAGNLKFDVREATEAEATRLLKARTTGLRLVVAGSTLEGEETAMLEAWPRLLAADAHLAMVIAPRHPERFAAVAALLEQSGALWTRRSDWKDTPNTLRPLLPGGIVLLDTIGELASVYSLAAVAFVGGSLSVAGHNPLEPAQFGVPIVMGPHYANFRAITEDLRVHDALRIATREELASTLTDLLMNRDDAAAMGERARKVFNQQAGATERSVEAMRELLSVTVSRGETR